MLLTGELLTARTATQRQLALASDSALASVRKEVEALACQLQECRASVEALLDFSDELTDLDDGSVLIDIRRRIRECYEKAKELELCSRATLRVKEGGTVTLAGNTNAGKSSLLNALAQHSAAIVSSIPGTTRDVVRLALDRFCISVYQA